MGTHGRALPPPTDAASAWTTALVTSLGALVLALSALVAATYDGPLLADPRPGTQEQSSEGTGGEVEPSREQPGTEPPAPDVPGAGDASIWPVLLLFLVLAVALAVVVVAVAVLASLRLVRRRRRLSGRVAPRSTVGLAGVEDPDDDLPPELGDTLDLALAALAAGPPRNAIVATWVRLEEAVEARGLPRHPADTPTELVERAMAAQGLEAAAIRRLAELYLEARFSQHALSEAHREEARACLRRLLDQLGSPR